MKKRKTAPSFEMALKTGILPGYMQCWSQERLQAVKELYKVIVEKQDADLGKIIVAGVPCGGGKSSLLKGLAVMAAERMLSLVMMTDNNQRLHDDIEDAIKSIGGEEWAQVERNIAWLSDGDSVTAGEWRSVMLSSLVAISTQRYLMVNDDVRKNACTTYRMGQQSLKDVLICDEAFQDVSEHMCYYSDVKQFSGVLRETIRPDREWEDNIGETAKRAEKYADKLISDLLLEIDRINKIKLPVPKNGLAPEGRTLISTSAERVELQNLRGFGEKNGWKSCRSLRILEMILRRLKKICALSPKTDCFPDSKRSRKIWRTCRKKRERKQSSPRWKSCWN